MINGGAGTDTLTVDERGDVAPTTGSLTSTGLTGLGMGVGGLTYDAVEALTVNLGGGDDTFDVVATAPGTTTTLNGGPGNDTFTGNLSGVIVGALVASPASAAAALPLAATAVPSLNALFVNGEGGIDTLVLDNRADVGTTAFIIGTARIDGTGIGSGGVQYGGIENLSLLPSPAGATYTIVSTSPGSTLTLRGTPGA